MKCIKLKLFYLVSCIIFLSIFLISCGVFRDNGSKHYDPSQNTTTFKNPISPHDAADPFITYDYETGYYYGLFTLGDRLKIYRSRHVGNIITGGDSKVVYAANESDGIYGSIWAPEMHKGNDGKWYIYTSGTTDPSNEEKHLFVV